MRTKLLITFWVRAKSLIRSHKITQEKFAKYAGINFYTFRNWLHYGILPDVVSGYKIATALGVSMEYLVTGVDGKAVKRREKETAKRKIATAKIKKMASLIEKNAKIIG